MATGERIKFIRNLRGMTQKYLGMLVGFDKSAADVRIAQYESDARKPKEDLIKNIAHALDVSPDALTVPNIDHDIGLMHTLFTLEDIYGLKINNIDGELCLTLDKTKGQTYLGMYEMFKSWYKESEKLDTGNITKDEYDEWRYNYPKSDDSGRFVKVPSKGLSDMILGEFQNKLDK